MAITYFEMSYPNFVLGAIIDPEEANQNNYEITTKANALITETNKQEVDIANLTAVKATIVYVDDRFANLSGVGRTTETVKQNAANMIIHKTSTDHDYKYYLKTEIDSKVSVINSNLVSNVATLNSTINSNIATLNATINSKIATVTSANTANTLALSNHKLSSDHDTRYYTKEELIPWLRGGDTTIREEVYKIVTSNNGDGTFNYTDGTNAYIGTIDINGYQVFTLRKGVYELGANRLEVIINDTLRRSVASGGIVEVDNKTIALTMPEGNGAEITIKYYERIGVVAEYNIKLSVAKPPKNDGKTMWFKVIG